MPGHSKATTRYLAGIDHELARVARQAIDLAAAQEPTLRIVVTEGRRTEAMQAALMRAGATRSPRSPHCDGRGVRLGVVVDRERRGELQLAFRAAAAMRAAALDLKTDVRWCWCWRPLASLPTVIDYRVLPASDWPDAWGFVVAG